MILCTEEIKKLIDHRTNTMLTSLIVHTHLDVLPMYGDPLVSVRGALLMVKAQGMHELVHNNTVMNASWIL